ncbi:MAG: hypothetical protein A4E53_02089 [Pelotomaculum sp. PtaB.Bin104]|nr:MAG: hypothetical protein A4E53_02089 [Pelotomaculum sp. PtaB.Bin104]
MFLHIGDDVVVLKKDIVAILEINTESSPTTKEFLEIAKDEGFIEYISEKEKGKSYIVTTNKVFLSTISCSTLKKRSDSLLNIFPS